MELKGLILSGGAGTRLRPITHTSAKQLVPVANKPILFYGIESLKNAGVQEIGIIVGDTEEEIREAVGDGSAWGVNVSYIHQEAPLGLAHAVLTAADFLGDSAFVMYLGDNLIKEGIAGFVEEFRQKECDAMILLAHVSEPERFGVARLEGNRVVELVEKPKQPQSDLALVGAYMFKPCLMEAARATKFLVTVEDHFPEGGLAEAVRSALAANPAPVYSLAVRRKPKSGKPAELMDYEEISQNGIVSLIKRVQERL